MARATWRSPVVVQLLRLHTQGLRETDLCWSMELEGEHDLDMCDMVVINGACVYLCKQVEVQLQDQVFQDEMDWDLGDPQNTPWRYAHAVCFDLGLGWDAAAAVAAAVELQLRAKLEVRHGIACRLEVHLDGVTTLKHTTMDHLMTCVQLSAGSYGSWFQGRARA